MTGVMTGEQIAAIVLRALPNNVTDTLLSRLPEERATKLRALMAAAGPVSPADLREALRQFRDMQRIANRLIPDVATLQNNLPGASNPANMAVTSDQDREVMELAVPKRKLAPTFRLPETADFIQALRVIPVDFLFKAIQDEQLTTIAMVMSNVDQEIATQLMKRFPQERRTEIALRLAQPGIRNSAMLESLAKGVLIKAQKIADQVPEPTNDERIDSLSAMLKALPRNERMEILTNLTEKNPDLSAAVKEKLYSFEDIMRIPDRQLQSMLVELEMKVLALAIAGVDPKLSKKVSANMSNRARDMLTEEVSMIGEPAPAKVKEAQKTVTLLIRKFEEEGRIELEG